MHGISGRWNARGPGPIPERSLLDLFRRCRQIFLTGFGTLGNISIIFTLIKQQRAPTGIWWPQVGPSRPCRRWGPRNLWFIMFSAKLPLLPLKIFFYFLFFLSTSGPRGAPLRAGGPTTCSRCSHLWRGTGYDDTRQLVFSLVLH